MTFIILYLIRIFITINTQNKHWSFKLGYIFQNKSKKGNLEGISHEVDLYIKHIKERFGRFEHAPFKTPYDPRREEEQIKILYPKCSLPFELGPLDHTLRRRKRTYSFSGSERDSTTGTPTPSDLEDNMNNSGGTGNAVLQLPESQHISTPTDMKGIFKGKCTLF